MRRVLVPTMILVGVASLLALTAGVGSAGGKEHLGDVARFNNDLSGLEEVPPADRDADGRAKVTLDTETGEVCFRAQFGNVGIPNRGHIHVGGAGANGAIVVTFFELATNLTSPVNDELEDGDFSDCVMADATLVEQIAANPTGYYVNFHNTRFPGGAMRCQLVDA